MERKLRVAVEKHGGKFLKWVSPGYTGVPDRILFAGDGRVIFVEMKTDTGRASQRQEYVASRLRKLGCEVRFVHGPEEAEELVKEVFGDEGNDL